MRHHWLRVMGGGGGGGADPDAAAYIAGVEAADGQALEPAVATAYEDFIGKLARNPGLQAGEG